MVSILLEAAYGAIITCEALVVSVIALNHPPRPRPQSHRLLSALLAKLIFHSSPLTTPKLPQPQVASLEKGETLLAFLASKELKPF